MVGKFWWRVIRNGDETLGAIVCSLFFQAENGIRGPLWSRGLGDVCKRQLEHKIVVLFCLFRLVCGGLGFVTVPSTHQTLPTNREVLFMVVLLSHSKTKINDSL